MAIAGISNIQNIYKASGQLADTNKIDSSAEGISFGDYLRQSLDNVNQLQLESQQIGLDFAAGKTDNIHQVMLAGEKADVALQLTMQIRNKVIESYNEIMRMQI